MLTEETINLNDYYTTEEIAEITGETDNTEERLKGYLFWDFIEQQEDAPSAEDLIEHITYQDALQDILSGCDTDSELGIAWSEAFA